MVLLDFTSLVRQQVSAIQALCAKALDFSIGSVLLALVESNNSVALWLGTLVLQLLAKTRAATSDGDDLDTWMADYGIVRDPATYATGVLTFARFTSAQRAYIPVGYLIDSFDSSQSFVVIRDVSHLNYDANMNAYILDVSVTSIEVPVQAVVAGVAANMIAGSITVLTSAVLGVDTVTNAAPFANGKDAESDEDLRARFVLYIASLAKATESALAYALTALQTNIQYTLKENENFDGTPNKGFFYAVVDDGSGTPSSDLLAAAYNALDAVRPFTTTHNVYPPDVETATIVLTVAGADATTKNNVKNNVISYVNSLGLGKSLPFSLISKIAYDTDSTITNVTSVTLNGSTDDLNITSKQTIKTDIDHVTVN